MALKYWFPMTDGTLHNQGLSLDQFTSTNYSSSNEGKLGKCIKTNNNTIESGMTSTDWIGKNGATLCGWFKFPESEIQSYIDNYSTTYTTMYGTLMGFNSYNGLALSWTATKPYTNFIVHSPVRNGNSLYIASYNLKSNNLMDKWVHIACIMDLPNKQISLYINGELIKTTITTDITTIPKYPFKMNMKQVYGGNGQTLSIPYYCNDIRVYDEPISPSEIKRISQGLVLHYSLSNRGFGNENLISNTSSNEIQYTYPAATTYSDKFSAVTTIVPSASQYTLSFYAKSTVNGDKIRAHYYNPNTTTKCETNQGVVTTASDGSIDFTLSTEWKLYYVVYTQSSTTAAKRIIFPRMFGSDRVENAKGTGVVSIKCVKFEEGNKPTPWTPSSSDPLYSKLELDNNIEYDLSGYQYNGTKVGDITYSSDTPRYNTGCFFNNNGYIDTSYKPQNQEEITIAFWFKFNVSQRNCIISCYSGDNTGSFIEIESMNSKQLRIHFSDENKVLKSWVLNNTPLIIGEWYFCAVTYAKNTHQIIVYINDDNSNNLNNYSDIWQDFSNIHSSANNIRIGGMTQVSIRYNGYISDLRIYATALSADDISELYGGGVV